MSLRYVECVTQNLETDSEICSERIFAFKMWESDYNTSSTFYKEVKKQIFKLFEELCGYTYLFWEEDMVCININLKF